MPLLLTGLEKGSEFHHTDSPTEAVCFHEPLEKYSLSTTQVVLWYFSGALGFSIFLQIGKKERKDYHLPPKLCF